jgi:alkylation response protein AidB-like acyl-CoA dehydrogenase
LPAIRPRDLLTEGLLGQLHGTDLGDVRAEAEAEAIARDFGLLREAGYLTVTLPGELGGLGCTLRQAACGQRQLAGAAPVTALAVSAHLYWTGAAADACRSGDTSVSWVLEEAARGAVFGAGHGTPGNDLKFASPGSWCARDNGGRYAFRDPAALSCLTPGWDWLAVHALDEAAVVRREAVLAFARRQAPEGGCRVARLLPAGAPSDVFTTSAIGWGCALLASVEFSAARRAFRQAIALAAIPGGKPRPGGHPLDRWPVAEASLRLDAMKARIAEVTHPWPLVPEAGPDLGGQHLIGVYAMRREVTDGSAAVRRLSAQVASAHGASGQSTDGQSTDGPAIAAR